MKERQQEISMHKEMLFSQLKAAEEERQTVSAELHMRTEKIDKLKKRLVIMSISHPHHLLLKSRRLRPNM